MMPNAASLRERVRLALAEDLGERGDVTTNAVFDEQARARATVIAKEDGILCGGEVFALVFEILGGAEVHQEVPDGARVSPGEVAFRLEGSTRTLLAGERTALNFLQRLSGIASATARFVDATRGRIDVCDTRKTTPLWRDLEKLAVACGGGTNHRFGLFDMAMLKDTHADGAGSLANAIARIKHLQPEIRIAAEARDLREVQMAVDGAVDLVMLDNMDDATLREAVALIAGRIPTEVTGGITLENAHRYADLGIDRISVGALTHSVRALDFSMRLESAAR